MILMKKILLITCLIFLIVFTSGCVFNNQKKRISKYIGINVQNCDIEYQNSVSQHG